MDTIAPTIASLTVPSAEKLSPPAPPALLIETRTPPSNLTRVRCRDRKYARYLARHGQAEATIWARQRSEGLFMRKLERKLEAATVHDFFSRREMTRARRAGRKVTNHVRTFPSLDFPQQQQGKICPILPINDDEEEGGEFPGRIVIQGRVEAIKQALAEHHEKSTLRKESGRHSYYVDASVSTGDDLSGIGIAYKSCRRNWASEWTAKGYCIHAEMGVDGAEGWAVWQALTLVLENARRDSSLEKPSDPCSLAVIYSDSQSVLRSLQLKPTVRSVAASNIISQASQLIQLGVHVELHWVPGHREVPGNYLADNVSQRALWCSLPKGKAFCYCD